MDLSPSVALREPLSNAGGVVVGAAEVVEHVVGVFPDVAHEEVSDRLSDDALLISVEEAELTDGGDNFVVTPFELCQGPAFGELIDAQPDQAESAAGHFHSQLDEFEIALRGKLLVIAYRAYEPEIGFQHPAVAVVLPSGHEARFIANHVSIESIKPFRQVLLGGEALPVADLDILVALHIVSCLDDGSLGNRGEWLGIHRRPCILQRLGIGRGDEDRRATFGALPRLPGQLVLGVELTATALAGNADHGPKPPFGKIASGMFRRPASQWPIDHNDYAFMVLG